MSDQINDPMPAGTAGVMTRRSLLLSLPGLALARRVLAQGQARSAQHSGPTPGNARRLGSGTFARFPPGALRHARAGAPGGEDPSPHR